MNIEVEVRSLISKEQFNQLNEFFTVNARLIQEDEQETHYFDCPQDLRIQKNNFFPKICLKTGKLHDNQRKEIEINFDHQEFDKLEELFVLLNYNTEIKWFRKRKVFQWEGIKVMLDFTKGYGYIIELEKMATEQTKDTALIKLQEKFANLNIPLTKTMIRCLSRNLLITFIDAS